MSKDRNTLSGTSPDIHEAMAMLHAFGEGAGVTSNGLLHEQPDLIRRFQQLDPIVTSATFAGLLTAPELHANTFRIEALIHLSLTLCAGTQKPNEKLIAEAFSSLGEGVCGRMEDPAEDVFVGAVRSPWGNFHILEGLWEGNTFYLQQFIDVVAGMPQGLGYDSIRTSMLSLLRLSHAVCNRAHLTRWQLGGEVPIDALPKRELSSLVLRRSHLRFTLRDLAEMGIQPEHLIPFVFNISNREALGAEPTFDSQLARSPLLESRGIFHLVLPTAVSSAIRYFVVEELNRVGLGRTFIAALGQSYNQLFTEMQLLGGFTGVELQFVHKPTGGFADAIMRADTGRYIHFVFTLDSLTDFDNSRLSGIDPAAIKFDEELNRRIAAARQTMRERADFRDGLTLIVTCGIGRGAAIAFGEMEWTDWQVESCSAYDLAILSWTAGFKPTGLWRMLQARDRVSAMGVELQNINGLINLVAWVRELDGHLVPHGQLPDDFVDSEHLRILIVDQNRQRTLRHQSAINFDPRVEQFIDGSWIRIRKDYHSFFPDDPASHLYASEDPGESGRPMAAFLAAGRTWWADVISDKKTRGGAAYERWQTVKVWLGRAAPILDEIAGLPAGPVLLKVIFESGTPSDLLLTTSVTFEKARSAIQVEVSKGPSVITLRVGEDYERSLFHPSNIAERALVSSFINGAAELAEHSEPFKLETTLTPLIVQNENARHSHVFMAHSFRDRVQEAISGTVVTISREDDAFVRLGLGWSVRDRSLGGRLIGKSECQSFLNSLVRHLEEQLIADLRQFSRQSMLDLLLHNHERAIVDRDRWQRTSGAMIGLHGATSKTFRTIAEHDFKLNAVFQTSRILIEIAICECPTKGLRPGHLDLSLLMAKAALLFEIGGWSDAIRWDMMKPELRVTPLGDVHANFDFIEHIVRPHAQVASDSRISESVKSYAENLKDHSVSPTIADRFPIQFAEAWQEQFGATIDETRLFIDFVENLGDEAGEAVLEIKRSTLCAVKVGDKTLDGLIAKRLCDQFILPRRPSWRDIPLGFEDRDRQPWRYRRRLSVLRRPILQMDDLPDPTLLIIPGMLRDSFVYMFGNYYRGDFPDHQLSAKMKAWRAQAAGARGTEFANKVALAMNDAGWQTRIEVNVTELLGRSFDRDYGDVDVLAWREDTRRVLIVECKDVQYRKTYGEIAEQLADFRGERRVDGKRDELVKHLDRVEIIRAHLGQVSRFIGMGPVENVESHLMFKNPVPMEFALKRMAEMVTVSRFDQIAKI